jgi:prophage regulatory protein
MDQLHEISFLRLKDILALYPVSKSAWYAGIASGIHPKPVKLGGPGARTSAWRRSDITALLESAGSVGAR